MQEISKEIFVEAEHAEQKDLTRNTLTIAQWIGHRSPKRKTYFSHILNTRGLEFKVFVLFMHFI